MLRQQKGNILWWNKIFLMWIFNATMLYQPYIYNLLLGEHPSQRVGEIPGLPKVIYTGTRHTGQS